MTGTMCPYGLTAALLASILGLGPGHAQTSIRLTDAPAAAETLACTTVVVISDDETEAERAFAETDAFLLGEARRLHVARVGVPFVSGYSPNQLGEAFPLSYDYCMPVDAWPPEGTALNVMVRKLAGRTVRVGFCPQDYSARCRQEIEHLVARRGAGAEPGTAAQPATGEAFPEQAPPPMSIRFAPWHRPDSPRTTREMVAAIQALQPTSLPPEAQKSGENSTAVLRDTEPRPLGNFSRQEPAVAMMAPASEPITGLVFSID